MKKESKNTKKRKTGMSIEEARLMHRFYDTGVENKRKKKLDNQWAFYKPLG